jgi:hypothetical protein
MQSSLVQSGDELNHYVGRVFTHELTFGYTALNGFNCALGFGFQDDGYYVYEGNNFYTRPQVRLSKDFHSFPVALSGGYIYRIKALPGIHIFGNATVAIANVKSYDLDEQEVNCRIYYNGSRMAYDTINYVETINDDARAQVMPQVRTSIGIEYRVDKMFFRVCSEFRTWTGFSRELQYQSSYTTTLDGINSSVSGSYRLRATYIGAIFSAGFYFPQKKQE